MNGEKYFVYIDESGIHKTTKHSSFALVYVRVEDKKFVSDEILKVERLLDIPYFHWSDLSSQRGWILRKRFMEKIVRLPFVFKYRILKNPIHATDELYDSLSTFLTEDTIDEICIDGKQPKWFESDIKRSLRNKGFSVRKVRTVDDRYEPAIRIADAVANIVRIYHDTPQGLVLELFDLIAKKSID